MWWLLPVLLLPFFELWSLLELGALVGVAWTLTWCVAMVALGLAVMRLGRARMVARLREVDAAARSAAPWSPWAPWRRGPDARAVLQEGLIVVAGGLLAFPGVGSDVLGLLLLVPLLRRQLVAWVRRVAAPRGRRAPDPETPVAHDVEVYPPGAVRLPTRRRPVVIDVE